MWDCSAYLKDGDDGDKRRKVKLFFMVDYNFVVVFYSDLVLGTRNVTSFLSFLSMSLSVTWRNIVNVANLKQRKSYIVNPKLM